MGDPDRLLAFKENRELARQDPGYLSKNVFYPVFEMMKSSGYDPFNWAFQKVYGNRDSSSSSSFIPRGMGTSYKRSYSAMSKNKYSPFQGPSSFIESKTIDTTISATALSTTITPILLNGVAQGYDRNNRIGRRMKMTSLLVRLHYYTGSAGLSASGRIMVVYDKQPNSGSIPVVGDIVTLIGPTHVRVYSMQNLNNSDRYLVLSDDLVSLQSGSTSTGGWGNYKRYRPLKELETVFSGTGATESSIATGTILLVLFGQSQTAANCITVVGTTRIRFHD